MAQKKSAGSLGAKVAVGAGVVALASAAYLLFGPEGKKHRKDLKSWMLKMKAEALEKMESIEELSGPAYEAMLTELASKYKAMKNIDAKDVEKEVSALKKNFKDMMKMAKTKAASKKSRN